MVCVRKEEGKLWRISSCSVNGWSLLLTRPVSDLSSAGVPSYESKPLQRGSNDSLAGQQNMHGLVDSSDPEMELAESEDVSVSKKRRFCAGFSVMNIRCWRREKNYSYTFFL